MMVAERPIFLTASWRFLAMLNYEIDPAALAARVPAGTEIDLWNGRALVSMVGFLFLDTRLRGVPIPFHRDFEEVNLRFYVRRRGPEGWRRGVVFVKEIVPRRALAAVANRVYGESYVAMPMRHGVDLEEGRLREGGGVEYGWRHRGAWQALRARTAGPAAPAPAGSEEEFVTEHYWGYARPPGGGSIEYRVEHPRWNVWQVAAAELECDAADLYGPEFAAPLAARSTSAFVADGSAVAVRAGARIGL
jgi:uncharacterized protein YqjF (DUF2071 family)